MAYADPRQVYTSMGLYGFQPFAYTSLGLIQYSPGSVSDRDPVRATVYAMATSPIALREDSVND